MDSRNREATGSIPVRGVLFFARELRVFNFVVNKSSFMLVLWLLVIELWLVWMLWVAKTKLSVMLSTSLNTKFPHIHHFILHIQVRAKCEREILRHLVRFTMWSSLCSRPDVRWWTVTIIAVIAATCCCYCYCYCVVVVVSFVCFFRSWAKPCSPATPSRASAQR